MRLMIFFLDRALPITSGGLAAAYYQPAYILWPMGDGFYRPGQARSLSTDYTRWTVVTPVSW